MRAVLAVFALSAAAFSCSPNPKESATADTAGSGADTAGAMSETPTSPRSAGPVSRRGMSAGLTALTSS